MIENRGEPEVFCSGVPDYHNESRLFVRLFSSFWRTGLALIPFGAPDSLESKYGGQSGVLGKSGDRALDWSGHGGKGPTTEPGTHCVENPSKTFRKYLNFLLLLIW